MVAWDNQQSTHTWNDSNGAREGTVITHSQPTLSITITANYRDEHEHRAWSICGGAGGDRGAMTNTRRNTDGPGN